MDARAQLEAELNRLEMQLLMLEQRWLHALQERGDASGLSLQIENLFSSLGLVNAELAAIRRRDERRLMLDRLKPPGGF